ncbi:MAG: glycosyl hydrolase, partial [Phycisphaerales bacterium]
MNPTSKSPIMVATVVAVLVLTGLVFAQGQGDALEQGFRNPPDSARPRTWWHWTGGNITKEGITKDLEWMKRIGIAGMQLADVSFGIGQTIEEKIEFGSPEWLDAVHYAASEAQRLGLEMAIFSSAGWSLTGGPWVKPEQAMKKLVWSETTVEGPLRFAGKLPQPPSNNGPIRNLGRSRGQDPTYYGDSAVVAYRTPATETNMASLNPKVITNSGEINATALLDDDLNSEVTIPAPKSGGPAWIQFEFAQPFHARAITIAGQRGIPVGRVLASEDGVSFQTIVTLPGAQLYRQGRVRTFAFSETTAKFFRIEMTGAPLGPAATMSQAPPEPAREYVLTEAILHSGARVHRWEEKAGFSFLFEYESVPTPEAPAETAIMRSDIIDLTSKMAPDGSLEWDVPAGKWTILRMGYSLTGAKNRPAMPAGLGYEVDKLNRKHIEAYYHGYFDPIAKSLGSLFGESLQYVLMDSWEAGRQNWTDEMINEFRRRRGYDPTPYLPALAGRVVESAEVSDRFLWDFRRTLADMWADYHYCAMTELLNKKGVGTYAEAAGVSLEIPEDSLLNKSKVNIPMGEFWVRALHPELMYYQDVRGAASAAHVYGKTLVAAESFTGGGYEAPYTLKKVGDYWFAQGVNRIIFHTSAHQPLDTKPGNTMVGTHINRNITWAEYAGPFMTYLARNSFMLQQGLFVADLAYLLNEGAPSTMPIWGAGLTPKPPEGYDYDYVNADVLINRMSVNQDGQLVLPDGMSYRVLVLPEINRMTVPVLRKIRELVKGGTTVLGPKPLKSPSLAGYPDADSELQALANDLWGDLDGVSRTKRIYGKG